MEECKRVKAMKKRINWQKNITKIELKTQHAKKQLVAKNALLRIARKMFSKNDRKLCIFLLKDAKEVIMVESIVIDFCSSKLGSRTISYAKASNICFEMQDKFASSDRKNYFN